MIGKSVPLCNLITIETMKSGDKWFWLVVVMSFGGSDHLLRDVELTANLDFTIFSKDVPTLFWPSSSFFSFNQQSLVIKADGTLKSFHD